MYFITIAVFVLPMIFAQTFDPTTICSPDKLQNDLYDFNNNDFGRAAADFTQNLAALSYVKQGIRIVYDLQAKKLYLIAADQSCTSTTMTASQAILKCLPANAVLLNNASSVIIGQSDHGLSINAYEVPIDSTVSIRLAYTTTTPAIPVLRQLIGGNSSTAGDVLLFTNPKMTIDADLFVIPSVCPPMVIT